MSELFSAKIAAIFRNHYEYYNSIGIETIKQQAGQVEQVSADYQGRILFELLQNAFDKADNAISVIIKNNCLYIGNDGCLFSYREEYDYHTGKSERADFQSLCSISTSTKDVNTSIGNKGVGFKSVFAVAEQGYAVVHTLGEILESNQQKQRGFVSFRIYDRFKKADELPEQLPEDIAAVLALQIEQMQVERKDRGVPGYYYPVLLDKEDDSVMELLAQGFVTVVQVPFAASLSDEVSKLVDEIRKIHFQFVQLRIVKTIRITFSKANRPAFNFSKDINIGNTGVIACGLSEYVKTLAEDAGIIIEDPRVAIYFHTSGTGGDQHSLLYNYLPTKVESPFYNVDFHADFHTTVDRKGINWEGKIGAYNRALLRGCLELYFESLNQMLDSAQQVDLNIWVINRAFSILPSFENFNWEHLVVNHTQETYGPVRDILRIYNRQYQQASALLAGLSEKYFRKTRSLSEHTMFFETTIEFIDSYSRNSGDSWEWPPFFKRQFGEKMVAINAHVIPSPDNETHSLQEELIYREQEKEEVRVYIPIFVGITITSFQITDKDLRKALNIRDFTDRNEILKNYRQVSPAGNYHTNSSPYTESQQQELLQSIASLMGRKNEQITCTHRYQGYIANNTNNTSANLADFSLSTIFLKTLTGKYKPAQLCSIKEIDESFLSLLPQDLDRQVFLSYLGVSPYSNYRFVDKAVADSLMQGLDYIPALWRQDRSVSSEQLTYERVLRDMRVVYRESEIHPAVINDNRLTFMKDLRVSEFKAEAADLLVKQYELFPREFMRQVLDACKLAVTRPDQLLRFYQQIFDPLHHKLRTYLISNASKLTFTTDHNFYTVSGETDFQIARQLKVPVLCYYKSKIEPERYGFPGKVLDMDAGNFLVTGEDDQTAKFHDELFPKLFYLLIELSDASFSDTDYFENPSKITELSRKLSGFEMITVDTLKREIKIGNLNAVIIADRLFDYSERRLYIQKNISSSKKAEAIAKSVFNNAKFANTVELILFHKSDESLRKEYQHQFELYYQKFKIHWISDYDRRFKQFSKHVLIAFNATSYIDNPRWFIYSTEYESPFILSIYQIGEFNALRQFVEQARETFDGGIFSEFELEVDFTMYRTHLAEISLALDQVGIDSDDDFRNRLSKLTGKLGVSEAIANLRSDILSVYPNAFSISDKDEKLVSAEKKIDLDTKIEQLLEHFKTATAPAVTEFAAGEQSVLGPVIIDTKKVIYQGKTQSAEECKIVGNNGEEQVLYFFINYFLQIASLEAREKALAAVDTLIRSKLPTSEINIRRHDKLFNACLAAILDDQLLTAALIPFFYITLHYELSFIDLIVWYQGRPVLVEVKTTSHRGNNSFRISEGEVNQAAAHENYMLVRVTPEEMILMGNPIYSIQEKLSRIEGANFSIRPDGYKFKFNNNQI